MQPAQSHEPNAPQEPHTPAGAGAAKAGGQKLPADQQLRSDEQLPASQEQPARKRLRSDEQLPASQKPPAGEDKHQDDDPVHPGTPEPRSVGESVLRWIVPERNPAAAVYGLVSIGALLAAESGLRDTYPETIGSVVIAAVLYWFAHSYANVLGVRLSEQRRLSWRELWRAFIQDWAIVRGAGMPLLALLVTWAIGASQEAAVTAGVWTAIASLIGFELIASFRSRAKPIEMALDASVGASMGLAILALRALLH